MIAASGHIQQSTRTLANRMHVGALWNLGVQSTIRLLNVAIVTALFRLLTPVQYGIVAEASIYVGLLALLMNVGIDAAFIQREECTATTLGVAFYANLVIVTLVSVIAFFCSQMILTGPSRLHVFRILLVGTGIKCAAVVHEALLKRRLAFKAIQTITITSTICYGLTSIVLALTGSGEYSIPIALLASNVVYVILLWVRCDAPKPISCGWREQGRSLFLFSRHIFAASILWYFFLQGDNFAVSRILGTAALGLYSVAYSYGRLPLNLVGTSVSDVCLSGFSRLQRRPRAVQWLLRKWLTALAVPSFALAGTTVLSGPDLAHGVLGSRWNDAIPALTILAAVFCCLIPTAVFPPLYQAFHRPEINTHQALRILPLFAIAVYAGAHLNGVTGVAIGVACTMFVLGAINVRAASRLLSIPLARLISTISAPALAALVCASLSFFVQSALLSKLTSHPSLLATPLFLVSYAAVICMFAPSTARQVQAVVRPSPVPA